MSDNKDLQEAEQERSDAESELEEQGFRHQGDKMSNNNKATLSVLFTDKSVMTHVIDVDDADQIAYIESGCLCIPDRDGHGMRVYPLSSVTSLHVTDTEALELRSVRLVVPASWRR